MTAPLTFEPLFQERVWGGRRLEQRFAKRLPPGARIGESWEVVDRPEAQSVVDEGPLAGRTLGELWRGPDREALFGARTAGAGSERFPLLVKLLDCDATLSVQVHPPPDTAAQLGGEPKTETWVVVEADPGAALLAGLRRGVDRERFEAALRAGEDVSRLLHRIEVAPGDAMLLPSGRVHAIGAGNLLVEVQQNSDTTYRVYDFGRDRDLHVEESLRSIDFDDHEPQLATPDGETLVRTPHFEVQRLTLEDEREAAPGGECAIVCAIDAPVTCGPRTLEPGRFALVCADEPAVLAPRDGPATVLRALPAPG